MNVTGIFELQKGNGKHPPILFISIEDQKIFDNIVKIISKEMFLRIRKISPKHFKKIGITTIGDETNMNEIINYEKHELNLIVEIANMEESILKKVKMAPYWAISLIGPRQIIGFNIDKTTEQVLNTNIIDL